MRTFTPKPDDIKRSWHVIDAEGPVLGQVATQVATLLRGKHKPIYAPHVDTGDHVIIVNASKLDLSTRKLADKRYYRHSGYPGGLTEESLEHLIARDPERVVRLAIRGMLPKTRLGRAQIKKLKIYAGADAPALRAAAGAVRLQAKRTEPAACHPSHATSPTATLRKLQERSCPSLSSRPLVAARKRSHACGCAPAPVRSP